MSDRWVVCVRLWQDYNRGRWFGGVADRLDRIRGVAEETQVPPRRLVLAVGSSSREEFLREGVHIEGLLRSELS